MRVADSLTGVASTIKILDLTKEWKELKEKGDITDVFEIVNNDKEVLSKLEELEKCTPLYMKKSKKVDKVPSEIEINELGLKLKIPKSYNISKEIGIEKTVYLKKEQYQEIISPIPMLISKILRNIDNSEEKTEIVYFKENCWKKLIIEKNILSNKNNIVNLANKGIPVTTSNATMLVEWFYNLEVANYNELKVEKTINRFGWIDKNTFVPYVCDDVTLDFETGIGGWLNGVLEEKGNIENWKNNINEFLNDDEEGIIRFIMSVGFSSCLLNILNMRRYDYKCMGTKSELEKQD